MKYKPFTQAELEKIRDDLSNGSSCDIAADDLAWREIAEKLAHELDNLRPQCPCEKCNENREAALTAYEKARGE